MDEQKRKKIDRNTFRISLVPLALGVVYMLYTAFVRREMGMDYYVVLILCLGLHWLLSDVLAIVFSKGFEGKTEAQKNAYKMYAALNFAGFAGLGYFACSVGNNTGIWGALVYVMTLGQKRKYLDEYRGIVKPEDTEEADSEEIENEEAETEKTERGEAEVLPSEDVQEEATFDQK